jgi:putative radical SAM enzyme (TIGR03279 family)
MLKIESVKKNGSAAKAGLTDGDVLMSVGRRRVRDVIDFLFYADSESVRTTAERGRRRFSVRLRRNGQGIFGIRFEPLRPKTCPNKCIFCFVDQLPAGLRKSLYVKDEDYRFSFLYGNYVTMTNLRQSELERIIEQRLSPLYVSVHSTDPVLRAQMLGVSRCDNILAKLEALARGRIDVHAQVVVCPGLNDGSHLEKTLDDLAGLFPCVKSVAVVPVGLTRHRRGLPRIRPIGRQQASSILRAINASQARFCEHLGTRFVFASDEFYLLAGAPVPGRSEYEGFPQVENGVGLVRLFLEQRGSLGRRIKRRAAGRHAVVLTGKLAEPVLRSAFQASGIRVVGVRNRLLGQSVTVAGLLGGRDLLAAMKQLGTGEVAVIPENCLNRDGLFLDGFTARDLEEASGHNIIIEGLRHGKSGRGDRGPAKRGKVHPFQ